MINKYSNSHGSVWVINDDIFVMEKYYHHMDSLINDEDSLIEKITSLSFVILKQTYSSIENESYLLLQDWRGFSEPAGPEFIWCVRYDLQYQGE